MIRQYYIFFLLKVVGFALNVAQECQCSEIQSMNECNLNFKCEWKESSCNAVTTNSCQNRFSYYSCNQTPGCAMNNNGICAAFTTCSDYTVSKYNPYLCQFKDQSCFPGQVIGNYVICSNETITCSQIIDQYVCEGLFLSNYQVCAWYNSCISQDYSTCTSIISSSICFLVGCSFRNNQCAGPTCWANGSEFCTSTRSNYYEEKQLCSWQNNSCVYVNDTLSLNSTNCFSETSGSYSWKDGICKKCEGIESDNTQNLELIIGLCVSIPILVVIVVILTCYFMRKKKEQQNNSESQQVLPIQKFSNLKIKGKNVLCVICFANFLKDSIIVKTQCDHVFHSQCFMEWNKLNKVQLTVKIDMSLLQKITFDELKQAKLMKFILFFIQSTFSLYIRKCRSMIFNYYFEMQ